MTKGDVTIHHGHFHGESRRTHRVLWCLRYFFLTLSFGFFSSYACRQVTRHRQGDRQSHQCKAPSVVFTFDCPIAHLHIVSLWKAAGGRAAFMAADTSLPNTGKEIMAAAADLLGPVDIVVRPRILPQPMIDDRAVKVNQE